MPGGKAVARRANAAALLTLEELWSRTETLCVNSKRTAGSKRAAARGSPKKREQEMRSRIETDELK